MELPIIKNFNVLATTPLRRDALTIIEAGYEAVLTERVIENEIELRGEDICIKGKSICLADYDRVFFVAIGKCAVDASTEFERILGDRITDGIVIDVKSGVFKHLRSFVGTHPFPSEANIAATKEIVNMFRDMTERDLVLTVISGGGSSLMSLPHKMTCEKIREITEALWKHGANITEVNTVRKHVSDILGGQLAKLAYPASVVSFIFSDVPGNDVGVVASGPTVRDETTIEDAERILMKYDVLQQCAIPDCQLIETPKEEKYFSRVMNVLLVTNASALLAMKNKAEELGYQADIRDMKLEGIASELGRLLVNDVIPNKSCILYGGETTVNISGGGEGGRNQEFVLGAVDTIPANTVIVAVASDGWDNTDTAGAIGDAGDRERARAKGISAEQFLYANDSYRFWKIVGGAIMTGRTGINVADFYMVLKGGD